MINFPIVAQGTAQNFAYFEIILGFAKLHFFRKKGHSENGEHIPDNKNDKADIEEAFQGLKERGNDKFHS